MNGSSTIITPRRCVGVLPGKLLPSVRQLTLAARTNQLRFADTRPDECPRHVDRQTDFGASADERTGRFGRLVRAMRGPHKTSSSKP